MRKLALLAGVAMLVSAPAFAQTWAIDSAHSTVQFAVRHMTISNVRGDFSGVTGTVDYDGKDATKAKINATIDVNTINTREAKRDAHLKSADFFDAEKFPTMTFVSTSITPAGGNKYTLNGQLTIHGVTKPIALDLELTPVMTAQNVQRFGASATGMLKRSEYGLTWNRALEAGGVMVGDDVNLILDFEIVRK